jgi:uncharacterized membrane protein YphA (DoxX/SURF4 family)
MIRLSRLARARLGYAAGLITAAVGAGLEWGTGVGLLVGGVTAAASFLLLADVGEERQ